MSITASLGVALTSATNPDPNTLPLPSRGPFDTPFTGNQEVSEAWAIQAKKALFPKGNGKPIILTVKSTTPGTDWALRFWGFSNRGLYWASPDQDATGGNGRMSVRLDNPEDFDGWFIQVVDGSVDIDFDETNAKAA